MYSRLGVSPYYRCVCAIMFESSERLLVWHRLAERRVQGSSACSCPRVSTVTNSVVVMCLHEGPAKERDQDHRQPGRHLRESPGSVSERNSKAVLLKRAVEGVEDTLIRRNLVNLVVDNKLLERLGGGRGAVQGLVAELGNGRRLVSQRLGDAELDQRRCADRPRVAEDVLPLAVDEAKLGRRGLGGDDRDGCLQLSTRRPTEGFCEYIRSTPSQPAHRNRSMCCCRQ